MNIQQLKNEVTALSAAMDNLNKTIDKIVKNQSGSVKRMYKYYTDSGHGWLAVKRDEIVRLGLENTITSFSYQNGKTVYLEEDYDMSQFYQAKWMIDGVKIGYIYKYHEGTSPIRYYKRYRSES